MYIMLNELFMSIKVNRIVIQYNNNYIRRIFMFGLDMKQTQTTNKLLIILVFLIGINIMMNFLIFIRQLLMS